MKHLFSLGYVPWRWISLVGVLILAGILVAVPYSARTAGTGMFYPEGATGFRANLEWRTSTYGNDLLLRRTLLKVYANAGEYILLGSSAVGVSGTPDNGDIRVYNPGLVTGPVGQETIPASPSFSCVDQRQSSPANADLGRIGSRQEELRGPNTANNAVPNGYDPCFYQAPVSGVYDVVFLGPRGANSNAQNDAVRRINPAPEDFGPGQSTSVTAWDVTVRPNLSTTTELTGRLFTYYYALYTGGNARPISGSVYVVTRDGFLYRITPRRSDGNGFVFYSNQFGFLNTDGTPLYRDVMAVPTLPEQEQNQLVRLQGGVTLQRPQYPIFIRPPDPVVLDALGIPREPVPPQISDFSFTGVLGGNVTRVAEGGTFSLTASSTSVLYVVISRDGTNFDPTNPLNRVLYQPVFQPGRLTITWDGLDNTGSPFPAGQTYLARTAIQGGEVHFPALDVENSTAGTGFTLINPPGGECPPWNGGCSGAFYDDRGYLTADGVLVGTELNGPLCPDNVGNPPDPLFSDPIYGFDSMNGQRSWGFQSGGNPRTICVPEGGFGDKKGLDLWTYYPSNILETPLRIVETAAIALDSFTARPDGDKMIVRWSTSAEIDTWGYHLYRSADGLRDSAVQVTPDLIPARGRGQGGATYEWIDRGIQPGVAYTYWLLEVETDGTTSEYGPAISGVPGDAPYRLAIPFVVR